MWFKRKETGTPAWWEELDRRQKVVCRRLADWLGRKASRLPVSRLRVWVFSFLLGLAGFDLAVMMFSIGDHHPPRSFGSFERVVVPERKLPAAPRVRKSFRAYMDSLRKDPVASHLLDSLLSARPGLKDSIDRVERMEP